MVRLRRAPGEKAEREKAGQEKAGQEKAGQEKTDKEKSPGTHPAIDPARKTLTAKEVTSGMEIDPTQVNVFRGGPSLEVRPNVDVQFVKGRKSSRRDTACRSTLAPRPWINSAGHIESTTSHPS